MFSEEFKKKDLLDLGGKKKANVDHILVRDYVREIDIGAFQPEYGVKQRVSFNVILEVNTDNQTMHDNVDLVLSYDNIIEVIEDEIGEKSCTARNLSRENCYFVPMFRECGHGYCASRKAR